VLDCKLVDALLWRILEEKKEDAENLTSLLYERLRKERAWTG